MTSDVSALQHWLGTAAMCAAGAIALVLILYAVYTLVYRACRKAIRDERSSS